MFLYPIINLTTINTKFKNNYILTHVNNNIVIKAHFMLAES